VHSFSVKMNQKSFGNQAPNGPTTGAYRAAPDL